MVQLTKSFNLKAINKIYNSFFSHQLAKLVTVLKRERRKKFTFVMSKLTIYFIINLIQLKKNSCAKKKTDDGNWKREKQKKKQERMSQKTMRNFLFHKNGDCFFRIRLLLSYSLFPSINANLMRIDAIKSTHILFVENRLVSQSVFFSI